MAAVSNWYLYIGMFLVATGFGLAVGAVFIVYWAVKHLSGKPCGSQVNYGTAEFTQNNYYMNDVNGDQDQEMTKREHISKETLEEGRWDVKFA